MQPARSRQANWLYFSFLVSVPTPVSPFHFLIQISLCSEFTLKRVWAFAAHAWNVKPVMFSLRRAPCCALDLLLICFPLLLLRILKTRQDPRVHHSAPLFQVFVCVCVCLIVFKISRWQTQLPLPSFHCFTLTGKPPKCNRMISPSVASYAPTWPTNRNTLTPSAHQPTHHPPVIHMRIYQMRLSRYIRCPQDVHETRPCFAGNHPTPRNDCKREFTSQIGQNSK